MKLIWMVCTILTAGAAYGAEQQGLPSVNNGNLKFESALSEEQIAEGVELNVIRDNSFLPLHKVHPSAAFATNVHGTVNNNLGSAICGLVLANGVYMFSCSPFGVYSLDVPLDANGQITLFAFADGHFPFKTILGGAGGQYNIIVNIAGSGPILPIPTSTITFNVTDGCNDGFRIDYKFYDETNNLVWPSATTQYFANFYNTAYTSVLSCRTGALVCYGARTGVVYWGVDIDNSETCSNCCMACADGNVLSPRLTC